MYNYEFRILTSAEPQDERLFCSTTGRRFHEVVEERAAVLLVNGDVPAVLVEVDAPWLPRQSRDLVGRLLRTLVRDGALCTQAGRNPVSYVSHFKRIRTAIAILPGRDEGSQLSLLGCIGLHL